MNAHIGLEIRADEVRVVMTRSSAVVWHEVARLADGLSVGDAVATLLARRPKMGRGKMRATVAIGFSRAQIKRLDGLPALRASVQMTQLLREHASRVFLVDAGVIVIPGTWRSTDGNWWGAAIDRTVIDAVVAGAGRSGVRVASIVPTVCAIAQMNDDGSFEIDDGRAVVEVTTNAGALRELRRATLVTNSPEIPTALRPLGDDALAYIGAYAAAITNQRVPLAWNVAPPAAVATAIRRARVSVMAVSLAIVASAALVAPGAHATLIARRARSALASAPNASAEFARVESDLRRTTQLLVGVSRFDSSRGEVMRVVGQLGQALPESTAIVSLRIDSVEGSFIAVAPHVTDVLGELGSADRIESPRIVGAVTHETVAGARVERAAFRFRRTGVVQRVHPATSSRDGAARP